jgi:iron(III) transport system ATP-binding protein
VLKVKSLFTEYPSDKGTVVKAAQDVSFEVPEGKLFTLLGPSGCGKTTTLRSIAGLEKPTSGDIEVGSRTVYSSSRGIFVAPNKRNFGMVFQSYAIWPHMNVFQNVAFPLEVRKMPKKEIREKVMRVLTAVQLDHLVDREATKLSGGQQQRLALARALVMEPQLLLLDEPLSNLDAKLRDHMRIELKRLQRELGLTTIYVTHDQGEALALSDRIAVLDAGRIVQVATPSELYRHPVNGFVAGFVGESNLIEASVLAQDGNGVVVVADGIAFAASCAGAAPLPGTKVRVLLRPERIAIVPPGPDAIVTAVVSGTINLGEILRVDVRLPSGQPFQIRTLDALDMPRTRPGESIGLAWNAADCWVLP